jgi:hypothetical protein
MPLPSAKLATEPMPRAVRLELDFAFVTPSAHRASKQKSGLLIVAILKSQVKSSHRSNYFHIHSPGGSIFRPLGRALAGGCGDEAISRMRK